MNVVLTLSIAVSLVYSTLVALLALFAGMRVRSAQAQRRHIRPHEGLPAVVVIVAARDEELTLSDCLKALTAQDYPADKLTILVAEDHSTDMTHEVATSFAQGKDLYPETPRVRVVTVPDPGEHLKSKANAIHTGVLASTEELMLITDADCRPPSRWVRSMVDHFEADPSVGIVSGQTTVLGKRPNDHVQALDWTFLLTGASALAVMGLPITAMGNNMGIRRSAYAAVGGYPCIPYSVTEDYALFQAVHRHGIHKVRFPLDSALENTTLPLDRLWNVYEQRRRWAVGGSRAKFWVYGIYLLLSLGHLAPLIALILAPVVGLGLLGTKILADVLLIAAGPVGIDGRQGSILRFEAFLFAYCLTLPLAVARRAPVIWKGRKL
ncbi:hypothetical protein BH23BAC4_BH23BAC4_05120 [soil metagenome]